MIQGLKMMHIQCKDTCILVFILIGFAKIILNLYWRESENYQMSLPEAPIPEVNPKNLKSLWIWDFFHCHWNLGKKKKKNKLHEKLSKTVCYSKAM